MAAHIVIIEDDDQTARRMAWILSDAGHDAVIGDGVGDAIEQASQRPVDVVILDGELLPPEKGEAIARLRERAPGTRVIDVSSWRSSRGKPAPGADRILMRPFDADSLTSMVEELLAEVGQRNGG
jgi:DNA-binding response OmpR family regulator